MEDAELMIEVTGMKKFGFIFLIAMIVGCLNAFGGVTKPAKVEGALIQQIHGVDFIKQTATKDAAWGWSENRKGLYIIDTSGQIMNNYKPMLEKMNIIDVFPTKSQNGAWVVAEDDVNNKQLFFIDQCKSKCRPIEVKINKKYHSYRVISSSTYPHAWLIMYDINNKHYTSILKGSKITWIKYVPPLFGRFKNFIETPQDNSKLWHIYPKNSVPFNSLADWILYSVDINGIEKQYTFESSNTMIRNSSFKKSFKIFKVGSKFAWILVLGKDSNDKSYHIIVQVCNLGDREKIKSIVAFKKKIIFFNGDLDSLCTLYTISIDKAWLDFHPSFLGFEGSLHYIDTTRTPQMKKVSIHNYSRALKISNSGQGIWVKAGRFIVLVKHENNNFVNTKFEITGIEEYDKIDFIENNNNIKYYWRLIKYRKYRWLQYFGYPEHNELTKKLLQNYEIKYISPFNTNKSTLIKTNGFKIDEEQFFGLSFPKGKKHMKAIIDFGGEYLDSSKNQGYLTYGNALKTPRVNLSRGFNEDKSIGTVTLSIHRNDAIGEKSLEASASLKTGNIVFFEKNPFGKAGNFTVKMNYSDEYGSNLIYTWDNITVVDYWFNTPWIRTSILAVFIILMGILSLWSPILKMSKKFRGWLFFGLLSMFGPGGTTFAKEKFFNQYHLDPTLLNIILITFVVVLMLSGALNSKLFRKLAQIQPFSFLSHPALLLRHVRKRFYRDYYNKLYHRLKAEQKNANMECYCPLPATINSEIATLENPLENRQIDDPPSYLFNHLMKPRGNQRRVFLIEGIGGTGKSALARKTLHLFLKQFDKKAKGPIPIYISDASKYKTIAEAIEKELGDHAISTEHLNQKIERGEFVIIIDNLHEKKIPINEINNYLNTIYSNPSPLIGISRYHKDVHGIFEKYPNTTFIHPLPLTNETLDGFVEKYKPGYQLTPAVISACASPDNTFNPLLIRLALLSNSIKATNITDIYDNAIKSLLKTASDSGGEDHSKKLRKGAMKLCMDSYWETGERTITVKEDNLDLIKELTGAGLLVSVDERSDNKPVNNDRFPRWVRFFHDTMQSYLTARALNDTGNWDALAEAAGAPRFSDDLTDTDDKSGTELFLMCLETFGPDETRINHLTQIMNTWAKNEKLNLTISKSVILDALPKSLHQKVIQESKDQSIGKTLETAINICKQKNDDINRFFGRLAPKIYSIVYEKEEKKKRSDEVME